jgi:hypothetical protein
MNIFKILSSCNGRISETNISAMLVYLLGPSNDHGFGNRFLNKTVGQLGCQDLKTNPKLKKYLKNPSDYEIKIPYEFLVDVEETKSGKSNRRIDILLEFYKDSNKTPEFAIAIENKIDKNSLSDPDQIQDEILGLKKNYDENSDTELHCILISPACPKVEESLNKIVNYNKVHLSWKESEVSVVKILNEILDEEAKGAIDPLSTETKYIARSFIAFINNDFQSDDIKEEESRERTNYGKPIRKYLRDIYDEMDPDKEYSVEERKEELSRIIKEKSGKPLNDKTRDYQFYMVTVNAPSRVGYKIRKPLDERFNLFYYSDDSWEKIKKFSEDMSEDVDIWWSQDGEKASKKLSVLREQKRNGNL